MNVIRWLTRIEYGLCAIGFILLLTALVVQLVGLACAGCTSVSSSPAQPLATLGVVLIGLFAIGPALANANPNHRAELAPELVPELVAQLGLARWYSLATYGCTALVFFILFCLAAFTASETRVLGDRLAGLGWPLWIFQSLMVFAFGGNVVRYSIYAAVPVSQPAFSPGLHTVYNASSGRQE